MTRNSFDISMGEGEIRAALIEWLMKHPIVDKHSIIATEAQYGPTRRRADVLLVGDKFHAFEIKSDLDNLDRLKDQLKEYRQIFDLVTVVTTIAQEAQVRSSLRPKDGLLIICDGAICVRREPTVIRRHTKKAISYTCSKQALADNLGMGIGAHKFEEVRREAVRRLSICELKEILRLEMHRRYHPRYLTFLNEAVPPYTPEDIWALGGKEQTITF